MADLITLHNHPNYGRPTPIKVNGFEPSTWQRISRIQDYRRRKLVNIPSSLKRTTPPLQKVSQRGQLPPIANSKKEDKVSQKEPLTVIRSIKDAVRKAVKVGLSLPVPSADDETALLPHGIRKLTKKFQASYDLLLDVLSRHPYETGVERTSQEVDLIASCLRSHGVYQKLTDTVFHKICSVIRLDIFPARTLIFKQGDPGTSWYVILLGHVRVKVSKLVGDEYVENLVAVLGPGEGFGDQAIVTDSVRSASIISASSPTYLARVEKADYKRIMNFGNS